MLSRGLPLDSRSWSAMGMAVSSWIRALIDRIGIVGVVKFRVLCFPSRNFVITWYISSMIDPIE